jgi:hypothetical protein
MELLIDSSQSSLAESPLQKDVDEIVKQLSAGFNSSTETLQLSFKFLSTLVISLKGGLNKSVDQILPAIKANLSVEKRMFGGAGTNIKLEVLEFLSLLFQYQDYESIKPFIESLVESLLEATLDKFYKVIQSN